jgi:hypothetical protein
MAIKKDKNSRNDSVNKSDDNDPILLSIIGFLLPIIFLYGLFFLSEFIESGFFAFIYSFVLFISGFLIFYSTNLHRPSVNIDYIKLFLTLVVIAYLVSIVFFMIG